MAISYIFKNRVLNCSYFFKDGTQAAFLAGKFITAVESQVKELMAEVESNHPHIYVDKDEATIDSEALTPMEIIKREAVAQAKAELIASGQYQPSKNTVTTQVPFASSVANTHNIQEGAAGSDSSGGQVVSSPASTTGADMMSASSAATTSVPANISAALAALKGN